jgi:hypothetical protein
VATVGFWAGDTLGLGAEAVLAAVDAVALAWLAAAPPLSEAEHIRAEVRDYLLRSEDDILDNGEVPADAPVPDLGAVRAVRQQGWLLLLRVIRRLPPHAVTPQTRYVLPPPCHRQAPSRGGRHLITLNNFRP